MKDDVKAAVEKYLDPTAFPTRQSPVDMAFAIFYLMARMPDKEKTLEGETSKDKKSFRYPLTVPQQYLVAFLESLLKAGVSECRQNLQYANRESIEARDSDWSELWFCIYWAVFTVFGVCLLLFRRP
jgi:hypothetical protein